MHNHAHVQVGKHRKRRRRRKKLKFGKYVKSGAKPRGTVDERRTEKRASVVQKVEEAMQHDFINHITNTQNGWEGRVCAWSVHSGKKSLSCNFFRMSQSSPFLSTVFNEYKLNSGHNGLQHKEISKI